MADPDLDAVLLGKADLRQVGWYFPEHFCIARSMLQDRSPHVPASVKRLDEMHCEHAVPTYVLVKR